MARPVGLIALTALAYFLSARLAYTFAIPGGVVTLWFPSGVILGLLLLSARRDWPWMSLAAVLGSIASDSVQGYPAGFIAAAAAANAFETLGIAWLVSTRLRVPVQLATVRDVLALSAIGMAGNAVTSIAGAWAMSSWFSRDFLSAWLVWWAGDGLAMLIITPVFLVWRGTKEWLRQIDGEGLIQAGIIVVALSVGAQLSLGTSSSWSQPYLVLPLLFAACLRFGPRGAAIGTLITATVATWHAAIGAGPFARHFSSAVEAALQLYVYLGLAGISAFILAAMLSERSTAEKRHIDTEDRMRFALEMSKVGVWETNLRTGESYWSATCEEMHGLARGTFGRTLDAFMAAIHPDDVAGVSAAINTAVENRTNAVLEYRVAGGDCTRRIRATGHFVYDDAGVAVRGAGVAVDVTDQRELEEQLRHSRKMDVLGQLAGGIAHDFNNILTAIHGYGAFALEQAPPGSPMREDLSEVIAGAQRAEGLTRQLLAFSRRQILAPKVLDLAELVRGMEPMLKRLIGEHLEIGVDAPVGTAFVKADPGQMEQVVLNLAVNARDAMPDGGIIRIEVARVKEEVRLVVRDNGIGMSKATAGRIFEPFFTTKQPGKGTGLGLATVHGIVEQSGGRISVRSELGQGAEFTISLPWEKDGQALRSVERSNRSARARREEAVLVVEDDDALRRLTQRLLTSAGYTVLTASTPKGAIDIACAPGRRIDLVLTDVVLPEMNGRDLVDILRVGRPGVAVLFMSGYTDDEIVKRGVLEQEVEFVQKPFDPAMLLERVRSTIDRTRAGAFA